MVDYNQALKDADPNTSVLKKAFELAMANEPVHGEPVPGGDVFSGPLQPLGTAGIIWYSFGDSPYNNPTTPPFNQAKTVTFEEQGQGIDGEITFTPTPSWQVVFQFSHQKREISGSGFHLVDPIGPDGINYGTEYDVWNYLLGRENFADPTRPSTYNGASVQGARPVPCAANLPGPADPVRVPGQPAGWPDRRRRGPVREFGGDARHHRWRYAVCQPVPTAQASGTL